jgi:acetylornithine deacetylase/succinyl-diaminopimelate desuccinylase-like protein
MTTSSATAIEPQLEAAFLAIVADPAVAGALQQLKTDELVTLEEQKRVSEIPSPPFGEARRAQHYLARMRDLGLADAGIDTEGNVVGLRKGVGLRRGAGRKPKLVVSAHLDTVFAAGTNVEVTEKDGVLYAPGIGDDGRGLAALLALLRALNTANLATVGDILFVGTVGEEGLGDLRGVKALFRDHADIDGFVSIDKMGVHRIVNQASGSRRYKITFKGPGGHSFNDFGQPSAIHAMGRAIAKISDIRTPADPKTTFTVGIVEGGQSVNAIAAQASLLVDMRSSQREAMLELERAVLGLIESAVADENRRWEADKMSFELHSVGDRPAGVTPENAIIVQAARRAVAAVTGGTGAQLVVSSTDANIAMSRGIPAVTIGGGGEGGDAHTTGEWYRPTESHLGPQSALLLVLALSGLEGVTKPMLSGFTPGS